MLQAVPLPCFATCNFRTTSSLHFLRSSVASAITTMSSTTFVVSSAVPTRRFSARILTSTFVARPILLLPAVRPRRASLRMGPDDKRDDGYVIRESEFRDPETDDDSGDGFMGEADMDDILGVKMPDDLASFEKREIQASKTRDELVGKLKDIAVRRRDILDDKRKGIGMDNVNNYLDNL